MLLNHLEQPCAPYHLYWKLPIFFHKKSLKFSPFDWSVFKEPKSVIPWQNLSVYWLTYWFTLLINFKIVKLCNSWRERLIVTLNVSSVDIDHFTVISKEREYCSAIYLSSSDLIVLWGFFVQCKLTQNLTEKLKLFRSISHQFWPVSDQGRVYGKVSRRREKIGWL